MPIRFTTASGGGQTYGQPLLGPVDHEVQIPVVLSGMTNAEIDAHGYLKPGVPLTKAGTLVGASPAFVYGVTIEAVKVADDNASGTISALGTQDIAVAVVGSVIQDMAESNLGRVYSANEIAGFDRAGSKLVLI
jgi:hypothetical protein